MGDGNSQIPLCVDLDGTLLRTDTLLESLLILLKGSPFSVFRIPLWFLGGRANLKRQIADRVMPGISALPVNTELLAYLERERGSGRKLFLVTGTDRKIGQAAAERFELFEEVFASDGKVNLTGKRKAGMLRERFGKGGFDYAGNERADLSVWAEARRAIVVNGGRGLEEKVKPLCEVAEVFPPPKTGISVWLKVLRAHQWAKNLLIFVPLLGAQLRVYHRQK